MQSLMHQMCQECQHASMYADSNKSMSDQRHDACLPKLSEDMHTLER